ncbi:integrase [Vibrio lentus]
MLVVVDNYAYIEELMEDILENPEILNGMHVDTLLKLASYAIEKDDFRVLSTVSELHTGIPSTDNYLPEWWLSDFYDDVTHIKFEHVKSIKEIRWCDVILEDGERLTSKKHRPLLNAFKYWVIACDNPHENGGKLIGSVYASKKLEKTLTLIDVILLNGATLKLSEFQLQKVDDAFWMGVLVTIAEHSGSVINDLYQVNYRVKTLLDDVVVSQDDMNAFVAKYPHVIRELARDEITLNLKDRVKACCWLHQHRYYAQASGDKYGHAKPVGNNAILTERLFSGKTLKTTLNLHPYPELALKPTAIHTEFKTVPNNEKLTGASKKGLQGWVTVIKLINTNLDKNDTCKINPVSDDVSTDSIARITALKKQERTKTLPPEFVFNLFKNSYELLTQFCPAPNESEQNFWQNALELLIESSTKSVKEQSNSHRPHHGLKSFDEELHRHLPHTERGHWLQFEVMDKVNTKFKALGIQQFEHIHSTAENRYERIRNNESMCEMFEVLQGATQLLLGAVMARRVDELVQLKPFGNLIYIDDKGVASSESNPYANTHERWYLHFKVKKTGIKGKNRDEKRPIPLSIARFVWQLEQLNQQAIEKGLAKKSELALFNYVGIQNFKLKKGNTNSFNTSLDALCDYFETAMVEMDNGEYRRHYVRQHQLRRFFALVFFWSKGYENMEALRWMLAHSDLEHLHNYITENVDGAVIKSAQANVITQSITHNKGMISNADEIERLRGVIAKRLSADSKARLSISTLDDAVFDYEDTSKYKTVPHISKLSAEQELENEVLTMLEDGEITLNLTWNDAVVIDGEEVKSFNLVLQVNELEEE